MMFSQVVNLLICFVVLHPYKQRAEMFSPLAFVALCKRSFPECNARYKLLLIDEIAWIGPNGHRVIPFLHHPSQGTYLNFSKTLLKKAVISMNEC